MHKLSVSLALLFVSIGALAADSITADQIIDRHVAAVGGYERIKAVRTIVYSGGKYSEPGFTGSGNAFMAISRPHYRVVGNPEDPSNSIMEGYDGSPWEYYTPPGVILRTIGHASRATRRTDIESRLGNFHADGATVVRGEDATIEGRAAYRLSVTSRDGFQNDYFIDKESFLLLARRYHAPVHAAGASVRTEARVSDWRSVDGVLVPFHDYEVDLSTGKVLNEMQWSKIEINRELPHWWFEPPRRTRTRLGDLLERLYLERMDVQAVLWSFDDFRRTYPDVDVKAGIKFIARQMQKMGDGTAAAEALLKRIE